ncbi:MAG: fibronectin type III domain-containing protein [Lachnospiraceae bacterium]|nr:fibronectin type III domain-containing protein [Lachnospiraceae bacterium]
MGKNKDGGFPAVSLQTVNMDEDAQEELAITFNHTPDYDYRSIQAQNGSYFGIMKLYDTEKKTYSFNAKFTKRLSWNGKDYGYSATDALYSKPLQALIYCGMTMGDMDNDGADELVIGGYTLEGDTGTKKIVRLTETGVIMLSYANGSYQWLAGGLPHMLTSQTVLGRDNYSTGKDRTTERCLGTLSIAAFAARGSGYADTLFVGGKTYNLNCSQEAKQGNFIANYNNGNTNNLTPKTYEEVKKDSGNCALAKAYPYSWDNDGELRDCVGGTYTWNCFIYETVTGNFNGNKYGMEQLICTFMERGEGSDGAAHVWMKVHSLSKNAPGNNSDANYIRGYQKDVVNVADNRKSGLSLCALDYDNDGMIVTYEGKESFFSDPDIVAVLQASPYYSDLESVDSDYIKDGSTTFGKSQQSGSGTTTESTVSAGVIAGFEQNISFLGMVDLGGVDFEVTAEVSSGFSDEVNKTLTVNTDYENASTNNSVVLTMTPYIRYIYSMLVPAFKMPTQTEYNTMKSDLTKAESAYNSAKTEEDKDYYLTRYKNLADKIQTVEQIIAEKEYTYGDIIQEHETKYSISIPQQPRVTQLDTEKYDQIAAKAGYELIEGNILKNTVGDPFTYASSAGSGFFGGKVVGNGGDGFLKVGSGNNKIFQGIAVGQGTTKTATTGVSVSSELVGTLGGVKAGVSFGTDYTQGYSVTDYSETTYVGSVRGIPTKYSDDYSFNWQFGTWDANVNGNDCIVLGYLVKDQEAPPALPKNIQTVDASSRSVTLKWENPVATRKGANYEIALKEDNGVYTSLAVVPSSKTSYTITSGIRPGRTYDIVFRSIDRTGSSKSAWSVEKKVRTTYLSGVDAPTIDSQPEDTTVWAGEDALFSISATGIADATTTVKYQWQMRTDKDSVWESMAGKTDDILTVVGVTNEMDGYQYRCIVSQLDGSTIEVNSDAAVLNIHKKYDTETRLATLSSAGGSVETEVDLQANVNCSGETATGDVLFSIENITTGVTGELTGTITGGTAAVKWLPGEAGIYQIRASYQGDNRCAASVSEAQTYTAYVADETGVVTPDRMLNIYSSQEAVYGKPLQMSADITNVDGEGNITREDATDVTWKIKESLDAEGTVIEVNGGEWNVNAVPGTWYLEAVSGDLTARLRINIVKGILNVKVSDRTIDLSNTTYTEYLYDANELEMEGLLAEEQALAAAVFTAAVDENAILLDLNNQPYSEEYRILVQYADDADEDAIEALQTRYEIYMQEAVLKFIGNEAYYMQIKFEAGKGGSVADTMVSNDGIQIDNGGSYPGGTVICLKAVPDANYKLKGWVLDGKIISTEETFNYTLTKNTEIKAVFETIADQLVSVSKAPAVTVAHGSVQDIINVLPKETDISTRDGKYTKANVTWSTGSISKDYNTGVYEAQSITVKGNITLPGDSGVLRNDDEVSLATSVKVTILAHNHTETMALQKATTSEDGKITVSCPSCGTIISTTTIPMIKTVTLSKSSYTYNGKAQKPSVVVKDSSGKTIEASDYTVSYASGRKKPGTYKVTIQFKNNYSGTVTKTFKINLKAASISKLAPSSKGFTVKWKKVSQLSSYVLQYSTSKKFTKSKTKTIMGIKSKLTSKKISKLKGKKTYYVRIRSCKKISGKNYYSNWSAVKKVKTKK